MTKTVEEIKKEIKEDIDELVASFEKYKEEGFQFTEIAQFTFEVGTKLVEAVENVRGFLESRRKRWSCRQLRKFTRRSILIFL